MSQIVHINARQQRQEADKLSRSEALNRTLMDANTRIEELESELLSTRLAAAAGLVVMAILLFNLALERAA